MVFQSVLIGVITAFAVYLMHSLVISIVKFCHGLGSSLSEAKYTWYVLLPLPFVGIALSYLFQRACGGKSFSKSLSGLILNLDRRNNKIPFSETFTHIFSSALSVGFGGSAGLEAPSVLTGAAIASNVTRFFRLDTMPRLPCCWRCPYSPAAAARRQSLAYLTVPSQVCCLLRKVCCQRYRCQRWCRLYCLAPVPLWCPIF